MEFGYIFHYMSETGQCLPLLSTMSISPDAGHCPQYRCLGSNHMAKCNGIYEDYSTSSKQVSINLTRSFQYYRCHANRTEKATHHNRPLPGQIQSPLGILASTSTRPQRKLKLCTDLRRADWTGLMQLVGLPALWQPYHWLPVQWSAGVVP